MNMNVGIRFSVSNFPQESKEKRSCLKAGSVIDSVEKNVVFIRREFVTQGLAKFYIEE